MLNPVGANRQSRHTLVVAMVMAMAMEAWLSRYRRALNPDTRIGRWYEGWVDGLQSENSHVRPQSLMFLHPSQGSLGHRRKPFVSFWDGPSASGESNGSSISGGRNVYKLSNRPSTSVFAFLFLTINISDDG